MTRMGLYAIGKSKTLESNKSLQLNPFSAPGPERGPVWGGSGGGRVPTSDWMLNLQILTSGGYQCASAPPNH